MGSKVELRDRAGGPEGDALTINEVDDVRVRIGEQLHMSVYGLGVVVFTLILNVTRQGLRIKDGPRALIGKELIVREEAGVGG